MNFTARAPRSRWVGPPVPTPKSKLSRSPFGRQRHYGAVELAGAGEQVNVNDVVEVTDYKQQQQQENSERHPVFVQVLSMWEDTFTGVFKFRARWLVQSSDLPLATLAQLRTDRQASAGDRSATVTSTSPNENQHAAHEVFLTKRVGDVEVRFIVKPITLCVSTSATTAVSPGRKGKMGPRLTHAFCDKSGDFQPLECTDPILKRARVRQANAVALASRADQEHEATKSGKPIAKSNGWLLPKRGGFQRKGGRDGARGARGGVEVTASFSTGTESIISPPNIHVKSSDDSGTEEAPNSEDGEWKKGEEHEDDDATDSDSPKNSKSTLAISKGFRPRKSARQRKSQRSSASDAAATSDAESKGSSKAQAENSSKAQMEVRSKAKFGGSPKAKVKDPPEAQVGVSSEAKVDNCSEAGRKDSSELPAEDLSDSILEECSQANVCPLPSTSAPTFQRRRRLSSNKRRGPLAPRPRRLAMPPMAEEPLSSPTCESSPIASEKSAVAVKVARPVRSRMSMGLRPKSTLAIAGSSSMEDLGKALPQLSTTAKRKRSGATKATQAANRSDYPPQRTPVGNDYQADIPDLLSTEERKQPHSGAGAKMVWRSIQDWDPQSRGMLAGYLHAAKGVVEAKQARPGVAVHVRLGGKKGSNGVDKEDSTGIASSYAVWAVSSGREAGGLVRVACSEEAQTDIPKSAIQRVQSQEQALSALVTARCVLDNFEPALKMLNDDQGSPESIEPWTIKQVRTLEKALAEDYDPNRRLHGWARPGMDMDREDFIDLAKVSKQVPGKAPTQVLSFYYKYLAAAEPLTDVVYGPEAAKARKQESISSVDKADEVLPSNDRLPRVDAQTNKPKTPARQVSTALRRVSPADPPADAAKAAPKPKHRIIRLSAPKPAQSVVEKPEPNVGTNVDSVPKNEGSTRRDPSPPANDTDYPTRETSPSPHPRVESEHVTNEAVAGVDDHHSNVDRRTVVVQNNTQGGEDGSCGGASECFSQPRTCAASGRDISRVLPPVPPDAEVLEVEDSDDADGGDATQSSGLPVPGCGESRRPSDMEVAARHINSVEPAGLSWVARQIRHQGAPAVALEPRSSGVLPMPPRSAPRRSVFHEGQRTGGYDPARYGSRSGAPGLPNAPRESRWEQPPLTHSVRHEAHVQRFDDRPGGGQVENADMSGSGVNGPGHGGRSNGMSASQPATRDDMFGSMAPCWRLLERAQTYMDKDQLEYMKGLILTHVRKPMSRDQLLERAESCLQEQDRIFAAFVKMFDRIDQPPQVPLYPAKRALQPRAQSSPYSVRGSPDGGPIPASAHGLSPPDIPPPRQLIAQGRGPYSSRPVHDSDERRVPMITPSQAYPRTPPPASGRVEVRRSIHPYDHNGAGGWRPSGVGNRGTNDAVGIRDESPPRRPSPGTHFLDNSVNPARYQESRSDTGYGGGARMQKAWSQQPPGEWNTDAGSSAAAQAEVPGSMSRRCSRGPAWGGGGGGTWS